MQGIWKLHDAEGEVADMVEIGVQEGEMGQGQVTAVTMTAADILTEETQAMVGVEIRIGAHQ